MTPSYPYHVPFTSDPVPTLSIEKQPTISPLGDTHVFPQRITTAQIKALANDSETGSGICYRESKQSSFQQTCT